MITPLKTLFLLSFVVVLFCSCSKTITIINNVEAFSSLLSHFQIFSAFMLFLLRSSVGNAHAERVDNAGEGTVRLEDVVGHQNWVAVLPLAPREQGRRLHGK